MSVWRSTEITFFETIKIYWTKRSVRSLSALLIFFTSCKDSQLFHSPAPFSRHRGIMAMWGREIKYLLLDKLNKIENLLNLGRDSRFLVTSPSAQVAREARELNMFESYLWHVDWLITKRGNVNQLSENLFSAVQFQSTDWVIYSPTLSFKIMDF